MKWIVSADSVFQIAAHEETVALEELYAARRIARDPDWEARSRSRDRPPVQGRPGYGESRTADFRSSRSGRIPHVDSRGREGAGRQIPTSRRLRHRRSIHAVERGGDHGPERLLREVDEGLIFTNLVETDSLWATGTIRSTSTAASGLHGALRLAGGAAPGRPG